MSGCVDGSPENVPDDGDKPDPSEVIDNYCKTCNSGNVVSDTSKDDKLIPNQGCTICENGDAKNKDPNSLSCECGDKMCGNPCDCIAGGTTGLGTSSSACWSVKENDGSYVCYPDYATPDRDSSAFDVCCPGGYNDPSIMGNWTDFSTGNYQCTIAEPCSESEALLCSARSGF